MGIGRYGEGFERRQDPRGRTYYWMTYNPPYPPRRPRDRRHQPLRRLHHRHPAPLRPDPLRPAPRGRPLELDRLSSRIAPPDPTRPGARQGADCHVPAIVLLLARLSVPAAPGRRLRGDPPRRRSKREPPDGRRARAATAARGGLARRDPGQADAGHPPAPRPKRKRRRRSPPPTITARDPITLSGNAYVSIIGQTSIAQHQARHRPLPGGERPLSGELRRVHDRDHQGEQHRPARPPVVPGVWLRRERAQAHQVREYPDRKAKAHPGER